MPKIRDASWSAVARQSRDTAFVRRHGFRKLDNFSGGRRRRGASLPAALQDAAVLVMASGAEVVVDTAVISGDLAIGFIRR
jgi:hypothetical protein